MSQRWELSTGRTFIWGNLQESLKTTSQHIRSEESGRKFAAALHVVKCHRSPRRLLLVVPPEHFFSIPPNIFSQCEGRTEGCSSRAFLCNASGVPRRRREPTYQGSLCVCASGFDTRPPELILFAVKSKPASVPSWTVAVAVRRRACGLRFCAVVRCASGEWGVLSPTFVTCLGRIALCTPEFIVPSALSSSSPPCSSSAFHPSLHGRRTSRYHPSFSPWGVRR